MNIKVTIKTTISNNRNETAMIFKPICDAVITNYPINIFSVAALFTKVIKIIDHHDRLLRYPRHCSKVFQESNAPQQQQTMFFKRISDADVTNYTIKFCSTGTLFTNVVKIIDQHGRFLRNPKHCSKVFQKSNALQQQQISHNVLQKHWQSTQYWFQSNPKTKYTLAHNFKASKSKLLLWFHEHQRYN